MGLEHAVQPLLLAILQGQTIVNRMEWLDALVIGLTSFALAYRCLSKVAPLETRLPLPLKLCHHM
eukprot:1314778-Amphidinium_carterae.2